MQIARRALNGLMRSTLPHLETLDEGEIGIIAPVVLTVLRRVMRHSPTRMDVSVLPNVGRILSRALLDTPYGQPLKFDCPLVISLSVTTNCPFACVNCYSQSGLGNSGTADIDLDIFRRVAEIEAPFVLLTGGEPAASRNIEQGLKILLSAGKRVYLSTNASVHVFENVLAEWPSRLTITIPVWGHEDEHDRLRGTGSFQRVVRNLSDLNEKGLVVTVLAVLNGPGFGAIEATTELARRFTIDMVRVTRKMEVGRFKADGIAAAGADFTAGLDARISKLEPLLRYVSVEIPEYRPANNTWLNRLFGIPVSNSCAAGAWMMHVDHRGFAFPCFTFEGNSDWGVGRNEHIRAQWVRVRDTPRQFESSHACIAEAASRRRQSQILPV